MKERLIKCFKNVGAVITAMAGMLLLIYIAFFGAVMNESFLRDVNIELGTHEKLGMSEEDLAKVAESMVYFTKGEQDTLQVQVTMNGVERGFYNEKEIAHIEDVRDLVRSVRVFIGCCAVVFLAGTIALFCSKDVVKLARGFLISLGLVIVLALVIGVVATNDMQAVIYGFHHIFFDNDLWLMNAQKDMVIWLFSHDMYGSAIARIGIWLAVLIIPFTVLSVLAVRKDSVRNKKESIGKRKDESALDRDII